MRTSAAAALFLFMSTSAAVAQACAPIQAIEQLLVSSGSARAASGDLGPGTTAEIWTTRERRWTLVIRDEESGLSCLMSAGENWKSYLAHPIRSGARQ
jgi:hypothetical protein